MMNDDCKNYTNVFIDQLNAAARARSRVPYVRPVKPEVVTVIPLPNVVRIPIGNRTTFNNVILEGINGLHLLGFTPAAISTMLSMNEIRVLDVLLNEQRPKIVQARKTAAAARRTLSELVALLRQA